MSHTLHRFHGGIHPAENKTQSTQQPIRQLPLPAQLVLPVRQHSGTPAKPIVAAGEQVLKGQVIAEAVGPRSVPLHAPTSGVVSAIDERPVGHPSGLPELCIVIDSDGVDQWCQHSNLFEQTNSQTLAEISNERIIEHIQNAGIAGLGGAGFPTALKLIKTNTEINTLIINGAECEPYISADDLLMRERPEQIIQGAQVLLHLSQAKECLIAVEDNKPEAITALNNALSELSLDLPIKIVSIPTIYPSGGEKQLVKILTGLEVPYNGIPADVGTLCQNVGTAAAIYRAVFLGEPLISRITTVTGEAIKQPGNYETLIGTPLPHLLENSGYMPQQPERIIAGGPLMGFTLPSLNIPLVKTSNCMLAPTLKELPLNDVAMECIRCGQCVTVCPQELLPHQLYWFSKAQDHAKAEQHNIFDCIECGACSYVCPSHIPLVQYYRYSKGEIRAERAAQEKSEIARQRYESRNERLAQIEADRAAARAARAKAKAEADALKAQQEAAAPAVASAEVDVEDLQRKILAQQDRLTKAQNSHQAAVAANLDTAAILLKAVEKQQQRLQQLEQELNAISTTATQEN